MDNTAIRIIEFEAFVGKATLPYVNYSSKGFVEISMTKNKAIDLKATVETAGDYVLDIRYSNGSGPWNTDNKCALRSLYTNGQYTGALVFPQRGTDEWSDWGFSNSYVLRLNAGSNSLKLVLEEWNINMNVEVNRAMVDYVRLIKL